MVGAVTKKRRKERRRIMRSTCHYCGRAVIMTRDHVVPRALGGRDEPWNVVPACASCNQEKSDTWPTCGCEFCEAAITRHTFGVVSLGRKL